MMTKYCYRNILIFGRSELPIRREKILFSIVVVVIFGAVLAS